MRLSPLIVTHLRLDVMEILHVYELSKQEFHADGFLPYHRACWGRTDRHADFISYLLKEGIIEDVDVKSKDGKTCREMTHNPLTIEVLDIWAKFVAGKQKGDEL